MVVADIAAQVVVVGIEAVLASKVVLPSLVVGLIAWLGRHRLDRSCSRLR